MRSFCIQLTQHRFFEMLILFAILVNTVVLASHHFMMSDDKIETFRKINLFFISFFTLEAVLKITAQRTDYFRDRWNIFDFSILLPIHMTLILN